MKKCLECEKEVVGKKDAAMFCSGKCKVKHHRKNKDKPKALNAEQRIAILFNKFMEALSEPRFVVQKEKVISDVVDLGQAEYKPMFSPPPARPAPNRSFEYYQQAKIDCESIEAWNELKAEIEASTLSTKQKQLLTSK